VLFATKILRNCANLCLTLTANAYIITVDINANALILEETMSAYPNLDKEILNRGYKKSSIAAAGDMTYSCYRHRVNSGRITVDQAHKIQQRKFPDLTIEYLFQLENK